MKELRLGLVMFLFYFIVFKVVLENVFVREKVLLENVQINKIGDKNITKPSLSVSMCGNEKHGSTYKYLF